nr:TMEM175 family protein [Actinomycetota bacterium]
MKSGRLEAFSDGVLAIIITIMVLGLKVPHEHTVAALVHTSGLGLLTYLLSFVSIGIYWNNHHHMFLVGTDVSGMVLWANLHLLFWLSLYPFTTAWLAESHLSRIPAVAYGVNFLGAALAYFVLQTAMMRVPRTGPRLRAALGSDLKGKISPVLYI